MMAKKSRRKVGYMVYFPPDLLEAIEEVAEAGQRSQWIVEAVREKLERERRHEASRTKSDE